jgi:putative phosphoesterase
MKIGLISDTHVPEAGKELPPQVYEALAQMDLIMHAGDMHVIEVLDWLERLAPVYGARGNGDGDGHRPPFPDYDPRVKDAWVLDLGGLKVGLTHGFPLPGEVPWSTPTLTMNRIFGQVVDVIVHGDTHVPYIGWWDNTLLVNPGSPTLPRQILQLGQVGVLTIEDGIPSAEIIELPGL